MVVLGLAYQLSNCDSVSSFRCWRSLLQSCTLLCTDESTLICNMNSLFQTLLEPWLLFLADDPALRMLQLGMILLGAIVIFLVFYTTRDILLRTNSFIYMFLCIILVALIPVIGFFLYLLIRPARTLKERKMEEMLTSFLNKKSEKEKVKKEKKVVRKKN